MKQIQFATKAALNGKTPPAIKWVYRILGLMSAIWILVSGAFPEIPEHTNYSILRVIGLANSIVYTICQSFGYVDSPEQPTNDGQDATA